jgi:hypothetical protein
MSNPTLTPPTVNSDPPAIKDASAPFDNPDADVILRSSDNVDFHAFKVLLSLASPVFKDMFTMPQALEGMNSDDMKGGLPIVRMTEGSKTLETLLTMCYPMTLVNPLVAAPVGLEDVTLLLGAAMKYDVATVEERARAWLVAPRFLEADPVMIYAIGCQWNLEKEAKAAARATIGIGLLEKALEKELDMITTRELRALLRYNRRCAMAMRKVATNLDFGVFWSYRKFACDSCGNSDSIHINRVTSKWLDRYLQGVAEAIISENWNAAEKVRLMEVAVQEARRCTNCSAKATTRVKEFTELLRERMNEVISEVALDFDSR